MEFRPLSTRALHALELRDLSPIDTSWLAFNYYIHTHSHISYIHMLPHVCTRTRLHTYTHRPPESGTHGNLHCVAWCTSYTDPHPCPWSVNRPSIPCIHTQQQDKQKRCMYHTTAITTELHFTLQTCIKHHPEYIHNICAPRILCVLSKGSDPSGMNGLLFNTVQVAMCVSIRLCAH